MQRANAQGCKYHSLGVGMELQDTLHAEERLLPAAHLHASFHNKHHILSSIWSP